MIVRHIPDHNPYYQVIIRSCGAPVRREARPFNCYQVVVKLLVYTLVYNTSTGVCVHDETI